MIEILPYNASWPEAFRAEAERIGRAFGSQALRIEHVGSTSIPGLAAKPVIDIQVSVSSLTDQACYQSWLTSLGYTHFPLGSFDLVYPFFKRPAVWPSTHHVHLCAAGSVQEREHLAFRNYLRRHSAVAEEYAALKRNLALQYDGRTIESQEAYSLAKTDFVRAILSTALAEDSSHAAIPDA